MHPRFNLLVIENEELALQPLALQASRLGHHVIRAEGSELPIVMMNAWQEYIQVVVLDWTLSCIMYGANLVQAIHRIDPDMPFVITSGYGENVVRPLLPKEARYKFLIKPFLSFEFESALRFVEPRPLLRPRSASA